MPSEGETSADGQTDETNDGTSEKGETAGTSECQCGRCVSSVWHEPDGFGDEADRCQVFRTEHRKRRRRRRMRRLTTASPFSRTAEPVVAQPAEHLKRILRVSSLLASPFSHSSPPPPLSPPNSFSCACAPPASVPPSSPAWRIPNCAAASGSAAQVAHPCSSPVSAASFRSRAPFLLLLLLFLSTLLMCSSVVAQHFPVSSVPSVPNLTSDEDFSFMDTIWRIPPILSHNLADGVTDDPVRNGRSFRDIATLPWKQATNEQQPMCHVWTSLTPSDLCARNSWERLRKMREMSLFTKCADGFANLQLIELFRLDWRRLHSEEDLLAHSDHLREGSLGRGCLLGPANSADCSLCFERLGRALEQVESVHWAFANLLHRFDCRLANFGLASATQPFSPNTTCQNCAEWYRKWLLVNLVDIWRRPPCINWCYYTQLACPHLATNKVVEFAGHPVFLCNDQRLSVEQRPLNCSCFHPCDMVHDRLPKAAQFTNDDQAQKMRKEKGQNGAKRQRTPLLRPAETTPPLPFDFFPASIYCERRRKLCAQQERSRRLKKK